VQRAQDFASQYLKVLDWATPEHKPAGVIVADYVSAVFILIGFVHRSILCTGAVQPISQTLTQNYIIKYLLILKSVGIKISFREINMGLFGSIGCAIGVHSWNDWNYEKGNSCKLKRVCQRCKKEELGEEKHSWNNWSYKTEGSCRLERVCQRCKKQEKGEENHVWSSWNYKTEGSCEIGRTCQRCKQHELAEEKHTWSEWKYETADQSTQENTKNCILKKIDELKQVFDAYSEKILDFQKNLVIESSPEVKFELKKKIEAMQVEQKKFEDDVTTWETSLSKSKDDGSSCQQTKLCSRCGKNEHRIQHLWGEPEYESSISCRLVQYCQRCGEKQLSNEIKHHWDVWHYESPTSCQEVRYCQRCGGKQLNPKIEHKLGQWEFDRDSLTSCYLVKYCQHCNKKEIGEEIKHQWTEWKYYIHESCEQIRQCQRCGKEEKSKKGQHEWSEWEKWKDREEYNLFDVKRICNRCKTNEYGNYYQGGIMVSEFTEMYLPIDEYNTDHFNDLKYISQHKEAIISAISQFAKLNNQLYPDFPITYLPGIVPIVNMIKDSPDEDIRVGAISGLLKLRRIKSQESEQALKTIFQIGAEQDSSEKVRMASKLALQKINNN
jgi:hypothetical protein